MNPKRLAIGSFLVVSVVATTAEARTNSSRRTTAAESRQAIQRCGSLANARLEYLHTHPYAAESASCHPSRAAILTKNLAGGGSTSANRPADKRQLAVLVKHLSPVERRELARFWLVEANYQKYQQQRARKPPAMGGVDRPRDPWLDKLAREQEEREQKAGKGGE